MHQLSTEIPYVFDVSGPEHELSQEDYLSTFFQGLRHALVTNGAAIVTRSNKSMVVEHLAGDMTLGPWLMPHLLAKREAVIVRDRVIAGDAFAETLEAYGISFFAAVRLASEPGDTFLCVFDPERRTLTRAQLYVLQAAAVTLSTQRELWVLRGVHDKVVASQAMRDERLRLLESVVVNANDAVLITEAWPVEEPGPRIRYANAAFTRATGYTLEEIVGKTPRILQGVDTSPTARTRLREALASWSPVEVELVNYRKDGTPFTVELSIVPVADDSGRYTHWVSVQRDITDRKAIEEQHVRARIVEAQNAALAYRAFHDELTGLRNRAYFMDRLEIALARAHGTGVHRAAVLFFDLDRFKLVNDSLGHGMGDLLLIELARRLSDCVRSKDLLARMGGDEFTVLVEDFAEIQDVLNVADRILAALRLPVRLAGQDLYAYASIGIAFIDERYAVAEDVLRDADSAMYRAKRDGGMRYACFDDSMYASAVASLALQMDLRRGIERGEFLVYYQPIVDSLLGVVRGVEALVRWNHPERGLIAPSEFIGVAEETGMITAIGSFVLRQACSRMSVWHRTYPTLTLNVNVSPRQFIDSAFFSALKQILLETGLPANALQIEITESLFLERADYVGTLLSSIRELGIQVALDDFGTGYSSLSYLERYRLDTLKIDRSFIARIDNSDIAIAIVRTIVDLARALNMKVVGEGVETRTQLEALRSFGCDLAQGYLFSKPVSASEIDSLLGEQQLTLRALPQAVA